MSDLSNLINKGDHILLQHFGADCKLMDEAEAENSVCLLPGHHRVHVTARTDILCDDTGTCLTEAKCEQVTNFLDGLLQDGSLHILI